MASSAFTDGGGAIAAAPAAKPSSSARRVAMRRPVTPPLPSASMCSTVPPPSRLGSRLFAPRRSMGMVTNGMANGRRDCSPRSRRCATAWLDRAAKLTSVRIVTSRIARTASVAPTFTAAWSTDDAGSASAMRGASVSRCGHRTSRSRSARRTGHAGPEAATVVVSTASRNKRRTLAPVAGSTAGLLQGERLCSRRERIAGSALARRHSTSYDVIAASARHSLSTTTSSLNSGSSNPALASAASRCLLVRPVRAKSKSVSPPSARARDMAAAARAIASDGANASASESELLSSMASSIRREIPAAGFTAASVGPPGGGGGVAPLPRLLPCATTHCLQRRFCPFWSCAGVYPSEGTSS